MAIYKQSAASKIFDVFNAIFLVLYAAICAIPFVHIFFASFTPSEYLAGNKLILFPMHFTIDAYRYIFSTRTLPTALKATMIITLAGTATNLIMTSMMAYPLAHKDLVGRKVITLGILITMLFGGGMIPNYLLVKSLGLLDKYWAVIIPGAIGSFNLIIMRNFFQNIPSEMEESAMLDGCNDLIILIKIILPLSIPVIATFTLFYAVGHWNQFFGPLIYISDSKKWPIQVLLRQLILSAQIIKDDPALQAEIPITPEVVKMAVIVVATVPIIILYPFLQKHFVKGIMIGSIKG